MRRFIQILIVIAGTSILLCGKSLIEKKAAASPEKIFRVKIEPVEESGFSKFIKYVTPLLQLLALGGIVYQINARRKDERLKDQLDRINRQITDFYGPLYSIYENGHRNYYHYLSLYGDVVNFENPYFEIWLRQIFEPTNNGMSEIITNKADLIVGSKIPDCLPQFCKWTSLMKVYNQAQQKENFNNADWTPMFEKTRHPEIEMQAYLRACFEVLKHEQSCLLHRSKRFVDEQKLLSEIDNLIKEYKEDAKRPDTWENGIWSEINEAKTKWI